MRLPPIPISMETMPTSSIVSTSIPNSLAFVCWKPARRSCPPSRRSTRPTTPTSALVRLGELEPNGVSITTIGEMWRRAWDHVIPFFAFAPDIRKMLYTTNAVEALHRSLRKIIKTRGSFPNDDAALKLLYLVIKNAGLRWRRPIAWTTAMSQLCHPVRSTFSRISTVRPWPVARSAVKLGGTSMADQQAL